ncbi:zinc finger, CCHC-type containing protein [Tanacetum coccineum]
MDVAAMKHMDSNFTKLDKFERVDFRRWQKKMHFLLSSMSLVYVLTTPIPKDGGDDETVEQIRKSAKWDNDDYVCRGLILNEAKYMAEDASSKKFLVSNFTIYKMNYSRPVIEQYNELLGILRRFTQHKMNMEEAIQVSCIINKLPPSWKDFKHTLKHLKDELTLVELGSHLRIEESLRTDLLEVCETWTLEKGLQRWKSWQQKMNDDVAWWVNSGATVHVYKDRCWFKTYELLNDGSILHIRNESTALVHGRGCVDLKFSFGKIVSLCFEPKPEHLGSKGLGHFIRLPDPKLKTLGERGIECIFVGYAKHSKAFRFYVIEPRFSSVPRPSLRIPNGTEDIGGSVVPEEVTEEDEVSDQHYYCFNVEDDPKTFDEAMKSQDGFKQKSRIDYFDTYALVACISIIRLLIAMASTHNLIIHQIDVKAAFLNGDLDKEVDLTKEFLSSSFSMKDMGEADIIFGIRIKHESNGIAISQSHYIEKVLKKFNYVDCTPVSTPMDTSETLMPNNGQAVSQLEYSRVIGCLTYAMTYTRLDIAFVVGKLSRYTSNPVLEGYIDASWISNSDDNSSTSDWVFLLATGKEAEWLRNLILEIPLWSKPIEPIYILCESVTTLAKAYSQMYNGKSRHLGVWHSMIHELITNGVVSIEFVRSERNLADHLTKGFARDLVSKSVEGMSLKSNQVTEC